MTPPTPVEQLPDGVYIGLSPEKYFGQKGRLGSSDLIRLERFREGWWWGSEYNPRANTLPTDAMNYGTALHVIVLEGVPAYRTRFAVEPDPAAFPGLVTTAKGIKKHFAEASIYLQGQSDFSAADWCDAAAVHLPRLPVWDNILADFHRSLGGRSVISAAEDEMLRVMHDAAMENDDIREMLGQDQRYPALAELSFFWTDAFGVKRRARFDKPVPTYTLDLKSLGNWQGRELEHHLGDRILAERLDVQVGDQHVARRLMFKMIAERGEACITGGTAVERAWLMAMVQRDLPIKWVWLWYQKPEPTGRAPVLFPLVEPWGGPYHINGYIGARNAIQTYLRGIERFGLGSTSSLDGRPSRPWSRVEPTHYTVMPAEAERLPLAERPPLITVPHFGWTPTAEHADALVEHLQNRLG